MAASPQPAPVVFYLSSCSTLDLHPVSDAKRVSENSVEIRKPENAKHALSDTVSVSAVAPAVQDGKVKFKTDAETALSIAISDLTATQTQTQSQIQTQAATHTRRVAQFHHDPSDPSSFAFTHALPLLPVSVLHKAQQPQQQTQQQVRQPKSGPFVDMAKELVCTILLPMIDAKTMFRLSVTCKKLNALCQERFPNDESTITCLSLSL